MRALRPVPQGMLLAAVLAAATTACSTSDVDRAAPAPVSTATVQGDAGQAVARRTPIDASLTGKRIAMISFANNPFWDPVKAGAEAADAELTSRGARVEYITAGPTLDVPTVERALDSAVGQGFDAIGVVPLADGACPAIKRAAAKVPVATFIAEGTCSQASGSKFFRGQPAAEAGAKAAQAMSETTACKGSVGIITGSFSVQQHEERRQGFVDKYKELCPDSKIAGTVENGDDAGKALSAANDFMTANADLTGIYVTAGGPFGAGKAVQQRGKLGQVAVVAYDFVPQNVEQIRSGVMQAAIGQDPFGASYDTAVDLYNLLAGGPAPTEYFQPVNVAVMTKANIDEVLATQSGTS